MSHNFMADIWPWPLAFIINAQYKASKHDVSYNIILLYLWRSSLIKLLACLRIAESSVKLLSAGWALDILLSRYSIINIA